MTSARVGLCVGLGGCAATAVLDVDTAEAPAAECIATMTATLCVTPMAYTDARAVCVAGEFLDAEDPGADDPIWWAVELEEPPTVACPAVDSATGTATARPCAELHPFTCPT